MNVLDGEQTSDAEALWMDEVKRRNAEIVDNKVDCKLATEVLRNARQRLLNLARQSKFRSYGKYPDRNELHERT